MKKIVKLTESDLNRIIQKIVKENEDMGGPPLSEYLGYYRDEVVKIYNEVNNGELETFEQLGYALDTLIHIKQEARQYLAKTEFKYDSREVAYLVNSVVKQIKNKINEKLNKLKF
jgi:hypothetical protein